MAAIRKRVWSGVDGTVKTAWVADYRDQFKKRHLKTFATKKAAAAWLVEAQGEVSRGTHTPENASIDVQGACQLWLKRGELEGLERNTMTFYKGIVRLHIVPTIGPIKLAKLTAPMLESWRDNLLSGSEHREPLSRHRARNVLSTFKTIISEAQRRGLVAQNAALPVKVDIKKRDVKKLEIGVDVPGKDDVQRLFTLLSEPRWARHRPLIVTAALTGMRASELRGLSWSAVDFDKKTITVRQRADEWGSIGMPKSAAGQREIPMGPTVFNTLKEWKLACPQSALRLVFPNARGNVQSLQNIGHRIWYPLQKGAGLVDADVKPRFNFHTLRHFAASLWIEQAFTPKRLQTMLGHSSVQMTFDRYGHLFPSAEDDQEKLTRAEIGLVA